MSSHVVTLEFAKATEGVEAAPLGEKKPSEAR
jgi:hypothetical protein